MSTSAIDRQIRLIYEAIDTGANKSALISCNKLLKKHPKNTLVKALKCLALLRTQKVEETMSLCDDVLASKSTDDATLSAMMHVLRGLGRLDDMISMFDDAYKQQPTNEELGAQTFFANVRTGHWKAAQQVATRMYKQFQEDRYLYWNVICVLLQANDPSTPSNMRIVLYKLAHRLVTSSPTPSYSNADRFHLHLTILQGLSLFDEAQTLLESDVGKSICSTSLVCDEIRRKIWRLRGLWKEEGARAERKIVENNDRNWIEFLSVLDATFSYTSSSDGDTNATPSDSMKAEWSDHVRETRNFLVNVAERDGRKDRSGPLALLELERRVRAHGLSTDPAEMVNLMEHYFHAVGDKACCFEDLRPYLLSSQLGNNDLQRWTAFLNSTSLSSNTSADVQRSINVLKLMRHTLTESEITVDSESLRAAQYLQQYLEGLKWGRNLPPTELQPADDLAILTGQAFVSLWKLTSSEDHLYPAVAVLEFALTKSQHSFQMRLLLIRIYRLLGAPSLALDHYRQMNVKQVQNDTLSHLILSRASTFSLASIGDLTYPTECMESSQIYLSNCQETAEYVVRAFTAEKYSQIPDFITFEDRLDNSLQRDIVKVEHVRMRMAHEPINSELVDLELVELKFIFDRSHFDNRDFEIIPNYQPQCQTSFHEQTLLFGTQAGAGWLGIFLRLYIRAFRQACTPEVSIEEKLLAGERQKTSPDPDCGLPFDERLAIRRQWELDDLTVDERSLLNYADALVAWLEPFHAHTRPPPTISSSDANSRDEKVGQPKIFSQNGAATNGHGKQEEASVVVTEAPEAVATFFDLMSVRFKETSEGRGFPCELLHIATLTQEALLLFAVATLRFKATSIVKVHKLGALVQNVKNIRASGIAVLREMSSQLVSLGDQQASTAHRKAFVESCKAVTSTGIGPDFVLGIAKNVTDARKRVLEGVGKGIAKVCTSHA